MLEVILKVGASVVEPNTHEHFSVDDIPLIVFKTAAPDLLAIVIEFDPSHIESFYLQFINASSMESA